MIQKDLVAKWSKEYNILRLYIQKISAVFKYANMDILEDHFYKWKFAIETTSYNFGLSDKVVSYQCMQLISLEEPLASMYANF